MSASPRLRWSAVVRVPILVTALLPALTACDPEASFPGRFADAFCAWASRCDPAFEEAWTDEAACVEAWTGVVEEREEMADRSGWSFDADEADTCIECIEAAGCEEDPRGTAACEAVWDVGAGG